MSRLIRPTALPECVMKSPGVTKCVPIAVGVFLSFFLVAPHPAAAEKPADRSVNSRIENNLNQRIETRANAPATRKRSGSNMRQFRDDAGRVTITNVPEKYQRRKGYVEVEVKYERIKVDAPYRKLRSAKDYTSSSIRELVTHYAKTYGIDENLVNAVIRQESGGNPYAVSSAGARGLMQLMPDTADDMGVEDIFDPAQNIAGGTQYLAKMMGLFNNNVELALAAYNAGPNAVKEYGGIPPYPETQQYVRSICAALGRKVKGGIVMAYNVKSAKPKPDSLPTKKGAYVIHFKSGYTQAAEKIIDEDPYYYVQYGNRTALVRKERVDKITEPA